MSTALFALIGYLAGSTPSGYWLVRGFRREDIRAAGSGNIGATNIVAALSLPLIAVGLGNRGR